MNQATATTPTLYFAKKHADGVVSDSSIGFATMQEVLDFVRNRTHNVIEVRENAVADNPLSGVLVDSLDEGYLVEHQHVVIWRDNPNKPWSCCYDDRSGMAEAPNAHTGVEAKDLLTGGVTTEVNWCQNPECSLCSTDRKQAIRLLEEGSTYFGVEKETGLPLSVIVRLNIENGDYRG